MSGPFQILSFDKDAPPSDGQLFAWDAATGTVVPVDGATVFSLVAQVAHGLSVGDAVRFNGSAYVRAQGDSAANAEAVGIVSIVADVDHFTLVTNGKIGTLSGLTPGDVYFLDPSTAGALTNVAPSATGQISKPVLIADSANSGFVVNMRGEIIGSGGGGFAIGSSYLYARSVAGQTGLAAGTHQVHWQLTDSGGSDLAIDGMDTTKINFATAGWYQITYMLAAHTTTNILDSISGWTADFFANVAAVYYESEIDASSTTVLPAGGNISGLYIPITSSWEEIGAGDFIQAEAAVAWTPGGNGSTWDVDGDTLLKVVRGS